ncbi:hypothetical protein H7F33_11560 [Pedobacter sp. PAMC26386]|nr:hypothetical protein H7F33_11560 [Pedobacter sp. PAMC26386]
MTSSLTSISILANAQDDALPTRSQSKVVLTSSVLNEKRSLWIYTPSNYQVSDETYPVLYLLDPDMNFGYVTELERVFLNLSKRK